MAGRKDRTVYSTDGKPGRPRREASEPASLPPRQQTARIQREKKGRKGKTVTVITGLQLTQEDLAALARRLKTACGSGGTVKDGTIEIQGDHRERIAAELQSLGYKTKLAGG